MKREYAVGWGIIVAWGVAAEIAGLGEWAWWIFFAAMGSLEAVALYRKKKGDSFSEANWRFTGTPENWARANLSAGMALWIGWHLYLLTPGGVGPAILCVSFISWLVPHMYLLGERG